MSNRETGKETMLEYAHEKYGSNYNVVSFTEARNSTFTDVLVMTDGEGFTFNVYHDPSDKAYERIYDDYIEELVDEKLRLLLLEQHDLGQIDFNVRVVLSDIYKASPDEIQQMSLDKIFSSYNLLKIICVLDTGMDKGASTVDEQTLFGLYRDLVGYQPKHLEYTVLYTQLDDDLETCISNIRKDYDNNWEKYTSVSGYIFTKDLTLQDAQHMMDLYKEVG